MNKDKEAVKNINLNEVTAEECSLIMTAYKLMTMLKCGDISNNVYEFVVSQLKDEIFNAE